MILAKTRKVVTAASLLISVVLLSLVAIKYRPYFFSAPEVKTVPVTLKTNLYKAGKFRFRLFDEPRPLPQFQFINGEGRTLGLTNFRGRLVLLNIWATWCVPCRREMPTLDRLQAKLGGQDFEVLALSIDKEGGDAIRPFYKKLGLEALRIYIDSSMKATREFGIVGIPTTLLIGRNGNELGRFVGPAEWDTPEMISFLRKQISQMKKLQTTSIVRPKNEQSQETDK